MNFFKNLRMSLLNFDFIMIYVIHKILVLTKNYLNYLENNIFECFFKNYYRLLFFLKNNNFLQYIMMSNLRSEEEKMIKDVISFFRLKTITKFHYD